jgi:2-iminobutanoate/2-iminopropanoate deaminase
LYKYCKKYQLKIKKGFVNLKMTQKTYITTGENIPTPTAPISNAVVAGNYCHVSGQVAVDKNGVFVGGTTLEQAQLAFKNVFAILKEANFSKEDIVFIDLAFIDLKDISVINQFYDSLFETGRKPARTVYQAAALPFDGRIKVMAIAIK